MLVYWPRQYVQVADHGGTIAPCLQQARSSTAGKSAAGRIRIGVQSASALSGMDGVLVRACCSDRNVWVDWARCLGGRCSIRITGKNP